jgi:7,8-dihydropterin-6-yl-methyl-4-(beta-D-ribofuranosyl)aminobenzene 5'-phosphate synthase
MNNPGASAQLSPAKAQITVLYDAFGKNSAMRKYWGYAAFIEYGGKRILFDTGNNPDIPAENARIKGIDLTKLDYVVMSHRHGDHMGGLSYLLRVNPKVVIYAPKEAFGVYGADLPGSFYRKDPSSAREALLRWSAAGHHAVWLCVAGWQFPIDRQEHRGYAGYSSPNLRF